MTVFSFLIQKYANKTPKEIKKDRQKYLEKKLLLKRKKTKINLDNSYLSHRITTFPGY